MSAAVRVLAGLAVAVAAFGAGCFAAASWGLFQPTVRMLIENDSGQRLRALVIEHGGHGVKGRLELSPPEPGASIVVPFFHRGEGGCQVSVTLGNGSVLTGVCGYVEPGYRVAFKVTPTSIVGGLARP